MIGYNHVSKRGKKSKDNEDSFIIPKKNDKLNFETLLEEKGYLFAVCDGMGGNKAGEIASKLCCSWLYKEFYETDNINDYQKWMNEEILSLNSRLFQLQTEHDQYSGMGTTIVSLIIKENIAYIHNVGDSRCYYITDDKMIQVTEDDSEVWKLYKNDFISKDEIITNKRKNIITQAIAIEPSVNVHSYKEINLNEKFQFLLCSDGLSDVATDDMIETVLRKSATSDEAVQNLLKLALKNKSRDDITILLISN